MYGMLKLHRDERFPANFVSVPTMWVSEVNGFQKRIAPKFHPVWTFYPTLSIQQGERFSPTVYGHWSEIIWGIYYTKTYSFVIHNLFHSALPSEVVDNMTVFMLYVQLNTSGWAVASLMCAGVSALTLSRVHHPKSTKLCCGIVLEAYIIDSFDFNGQLWPNG